MKEHHVLEIKGRKYIFFPYSLAFFEYSEALEEALRDGKETNEDIRRILAKEEQFRNYIIKEKENIGRKDHTIGACEINTVHACNMNCRYCFAEGGNHGKSGRLTDEKAEKIIRFVWNNRSKDRLNIVLVGGEPFLDFENFRKIVEAGRKAASESATKVAFSTISNGTCIDEGISEYIRENHINLEISLDSARKEINDFLRPVRNGSSAYRYIAEHSTLMTDESGRMKVNVTITPFNLNISETAVFLYDEMNACGIHFSEVVSDLEEMQFTEEQIQILMEEYDKLADLVIEKYRKKDYIYCYPLTSLGKIDKGIPERTPCSVLLNKCAFSPEGKIYPCDVLMYEQYCIGDIEKGFDKEKIELLHKTNMDDSHCENCWARYLCGGECLSTKMWKNEEQKRLRCRLKRHISKLRLYIYDNVAREFENVEERKRVLGG